MIIYCENEDCENEGVPMELESEDDRQEWYEGYYVCEKCGKRKTHRTEYDQTGLVISDEIMEK